METEDERQEEEERARQHLKNARAKNWPSVEKFEGTRLLIKEEYDGWLYLRAETSIGGESESKDFPLAACPEIDEAQAEVMVLEAVEWVSERHRA